MKTLTTAAASGLVMVLLAAGPAAAQICPGMAQEGWDSGDAAGWVGGAGTAVSVIQSGGNPDGYLQLENSGSAQAMAYQAPWIGDWGVGGIRELAVHYQLFNSGSVVGPTLRIRRDASSNGWYYFGNRTITVDGTWHSYAVPIDPTWSDGEAEEHGWTEVPSTIEWSWAETVSSVAYVVIMADSADFGEFVGFDNVEIVCWAFADGFESSDTSAWDTTVP